MIDLEVERDADRDMRDALQKIGSAGSDVEDRPHTVKPSQQAAVYGHTAAIPVDPPQIAKGTLHVRTRRVVLVEQFFGLYASRCQQAHIGVWRLDPASVTRIA